MSPRDGTPFYLYLNSSDVNSYSSSNTTANFKTVLGTPLYLPHDENWRVCLSNLIISNQLQDKRKVALNVRTSLIQPEYNQEKVLSVHHTFSHGDEAFSYYEPSKREYFSLGPSLISSIDIDITDSSGKTVILGFGQPTLIVLKFKRMEQKDFVVRFKSEEDPQGKASFFSGKVPPAFTTDPTKKWEVSLNSIIYNGKFSHIPPSVSASPELQVLYSKLPDIEESQNAEDNEIGQAEDFVSNNRKITVPLVGQKFNSTKMVFNKFKAALEALYFELPNKDDSYRLIKYVRMFSRTIVFEVNKTCIMRIPYAWAILVGSTKSPDQFGFVEYQLKKGDTHEFESNINYKAWVPNYMLLYANFIEYSPFGSSVVPVLRVIPLEQQNKSNYSYRFYEPKKDEYHPVTFSQVQNVQFQLRTIDGRLIEFQREDVKVILSLKFRERQ